MALRSSVSVVSVGAILLAVLLVGGVCLAVGGLTDETIEVVRSQADEALVLPRAKRDWTVIFYNASDFYGYNPTDDFARRMRSTANVNVVMLEDTFDEPATVWLVEGTAEAPALVALEAWGEINTGDDEPLTQILDYCAEQFPARRTMAMIYQHGAAWRGAAYDLHPSLRTGRRPVRTYDYLTPEEMRQSLDSVGGIDALLFTAPCLMGAIEPIYQLRRSTDLYIGSEPMSGFAAWVDAFPEILALLSEEPELSSEDFGKRIVESIERCYDPSPYINDIPEELRAGAAKVAMTAVASTPGLDALARALDAFALALLDVLDESIEEIWIARNDAQDLNHQEVVDLIDFAERCQTIPGLEATSLALQQAIEEAVTAAIFNSEAFPGAQGLSIFFPFRKTDDPLAELANLYRVTFDSMREDYGEAGLSLVEDTHWDEFLDAFYSITSNAE